MEQRAKQSFFKIIFLLAALERQGRDRRQEILETLLYSLSAPPLTSHPIALLIFIKYFQLTIASIEKYSFITSPVRDRPKTEWGVTACLRIWGLPVSLLRTQKM